MSLNKKGGAAEIAGPAETAESAERAERADPTELAERQMDELLGIRTVGRDDSRSDCQSSPYEPTPYVVLDRLIETGYVDKGCTVVDYGCGKGRVSLYLHHKTGCRTVGVELDPGFAADGERNYESMLAKLGGTARGERRARAGGDGAEGDAVNDLASDAGTAAENDAVRFAVANAMEYAPEPDANRFFFFNPFSAEVFDRTLDRIEESLVASPRQALVIAYYPLRDYVDCLNARTWLSFETSINCRDICDARDVQERIVVYRTR